MELFRKVVRDVPKCKRAAAMVISLWRRPMGKFDNFQVILKPYREGFKYLG